MKTIIHVNQHNIKHNRKNKDKKDVPQKEVITVKTYKDNTYCNNVCIVDNNGCTIAELMYSPDKPLSCGAHVYLIADSKNVKIGE